MQRYIAGVKRAVDFSTPMQEETTQVTEPKVKRQFLMKKLRDWLVIDESRLVSQCFAPTVSNMLRTTALLWAPNILNGRPSRTTKSPGATRR